MLAAENTGRFDPDGRNLGRLLRYMVMEVTADIDPPFASTLYTLLQQEEFTEFAFELSLAAAEQRIALSRGMVNVLLDVTATAEVPTAVLEEIHPRERRSPVTWIASRVNRVDPVDKVAVLTATVMKPVRRVHASRRVNMRTRTDVGPAYLIDFTDCSSERTIAELTNRICSTLRSLTNQKFSIFGRPEHDRLCSYHQQLVNAGDELWARE